MSAQEVMESRHLHSAGIYKIKGRCCMPVAGQFGGAWNAVAVRSVPSSLFLFFPSRVRFLFLSLIPLFFLFLPLPSFFIYSLFLSISFLVFLHFLPSSLSLASNPLSLYLSNKHTHWPLSFSPIIIWMSFLQKAISLQTSWFLTTPEEPRVAGK